MPDRSIAAVLFLLLTGALAAQSDPSDIAFVEWARGRSVPLDSAGKAFRTLDGGIAQARLIGVGESVHETEPFLTFRLQLLQDLVRRHRVTALVLESGLPEAMVLDDYVHGRTATVDFNATLPGGFGALEEIRRTMEWLREWNLGEGRKHPVGVYGADLPARSGSMVPALDRLQELTAGNPDVKAVIDAVRPPAVQASGQWWREAAQKYEALPAAAKAALASDVTLLVERVNRLSEGDKDRLEWARRLALVVQQNETMLRLGPFSPTAPRDQAMADNTLWVLGRLAPGERAVYWAHNAHVQRAPVKGPPLPPGSWPSAGVRFHAALGKQYYGIATAYGGPSRDDATAATSGSVDAALEKVATGSFLLPLHTGRRSSAVDSWLSEERLMRFQTGYLIVPLGAAFDAVAYFDRATRAPRATTQAPSALESGRRLTESFYAGRTDELWEKMGDPMRATLRSSPAQLAAFAENAHNVLGRETGLLDEAISEKEGVTTYLRTARFEKSAAPFKILWSFDGAGRIVDFWIRPTEEAAEVVYTTKTALRLPFDGEWIVASGGRTPELNHHNIDYPNRFAYDFARAEDAQFTTDSPGPRNEDYASWGKPILAPGDGTVAAAADGVADNTPGRPDLEVPSNGNYVIIDHGNGEFSLLAHLRRGSVRVREGESVTAGQVVGAGGNSGNSNGPHLHYNLQTGPRPSTGTGLPAQFLRYTADGTAVDRGEPTRGQHIRNPSELGPPKPSNDDHLYP
jgi:erythromycin esterase-like protein